MSEILELKSWPAFFQKIRTGERTSDMRSKADRVFHVGQRILLREYDPFAGNYTGQVEMIEVTHIISNDTPCALSSAVLHRDFCVLSIKKISE